MLNESECNKLIIRDAIALRSNIISIQGFLVAYDIGLFTVLDKNVGKNFKELCGELSINKRPLQSLLSLCASLDLIKVVNNKYYLSDGAKNLFNGKESKFYHESLGVLIKYNKIYNFAGIKKAVLENKSQVYDGKKLFDENAQNLSLARYFTNSMNRKSYFIAQKFINCIDLKKHKIFLDIGGGSGIFTINACNKWENLKGIIFDLPIICDIAKEFIQKESINSRISTQMGNMWKDNFPEADVHFYSDILHDWPLKKAMFLLKKSYTSMPKGGKILINEMVFNSDKTAPLSTVIYNLLMLLWTEGQQYSYEEINNMLAKIGFIEIQKTNYHDDWSIISAKKPD